jgi:hypothetical protein
LGGEIVESDEEEDKVEEEALPSVRNTLVRDLLLLDGGP